MKCENLRKVTALVAALALFVTNIECIVVNAEETADNAGTLSLESITNIFLDYYSDSENTRNVQMSDGEKAENFLNEYGQVINESGYVPYIIYNDNYEEMQEELHTDFNELALNEDGTYLILLSCDDNNVKRTTSNSFNYTYNGNTYSLRYLTVTAAEASYGYTKTGSCDLLQTSSKTLIENCLNTAVLAYISTLSGTLGTIASMCGLKITNFASSQQATLYLHGAADWTRIYTQVYSSYYNQWLSGSCIEYVIVKSYVSGFYYSSATNSQQSIDKIEKVNTLYSSQYSNPEWKKSQAVISFINSNGCNHNLTGDVRFTYNGSTKITLSEDF